MISILCGVGSQIQFELITVVNVSLSSTTNGCLSFHGAVTSLLINSANISNVGTGNNGGAFFVNLSQITDSSNSFIQNTLIDSCRAAYGGGLYVTQAGIRLYSVNFSNNTAVVIGTDIFENKTMSQSFYNFSTLEACCSQSEGAFLFALLDNGDKSSLLGLCVLQEGERYVSSTGVDDNNYCVNPDTPCSSLAHAIDAAEEGEESAIVVRIIGVYECSNNVISGLLLYIRSIGGSLSLTFLFFFFQI
jgi:hypothetical protein